MIGGGTSAEGAGRLSRLDGLRAIAVVCVIGFHASYFLVPWLGGKVLAGGFLGVDLFFVLSGFLMTKILLDLDGSAGSVRGFYLRRGARILPALYLLLVAQILYTVVMGDPLGADLRAIAPMAVGVGNWNQSFGVPVSFSLAQTWSLGVEMQFYVLWPTVVWMSRRGWFRLRTACAVGVTGSWLVTLVLVHAGVSPSTVYGQTWSRLGEFLVGAGVALAWRAGFRPGRWFGPVTLLAGAEVVAVLWTARTTGAWLYDGGFTLTAGCFGVLLLSCLNGSRWSAPLDRSGFQVIGRLSYSIYLWHPFVFEAVIRAFPADTWARVVIAVAVLGLVTWASTILVEEPVRRAAARYLRRRGTRVPAAVATPVTPA